MMRERERERERCREQQMILVMSANQAIEKSRVVAFAKLGTAELSMSLRKTHCHSVSLSRKMKLEIIFIE